jgi:hypothetical protein
MLLASRGMNKIYHAQTSLWGMNPPDLLPPTLANERPFPI